MTKRIVVVGGGYAGVAFVRRMVAKHQDAAVTLIDRNPYHTVLTEVHQVAAGNQPAHKFQVPLHDIPGVRFLQADVTGLDAASKTLATTAGPIDYDLLVLAVGGVDTDFGVPGVKQHAFMLHSINDALAIAAQVDSLPAGAPIIVAGGGLTGVELAAELGERFHGKGHITLVEGAPSILPGLGEGVRVAARRELGALGVGVLTGKKIARVEAGQVHFMDGGGLAFGLMVWACGVRANPLVAALGLPVDRAGRAVVDANHKTEWEGVYVIGDSAAGDAPTAQAAMQHGQALADHLAGLLGGRPAEMRKVRYKGTLVSLGQTLGAGQVAGLQVSGYVPGLMKRANVALWLNLAAGSCRAASYFLGLPGAGALRHGHAEMHGD
jgi:NADH:ubiquinone reductase (H+-translocating)